MNALPTHDGSKFDWSTGIGIADVSGFRGEKLLGRVYHDACDVGFIIRSHRTGKEKAFTESRTVWDTDGDAVYWEFEAIDRTGTVVRIYND